MKLIISIIFIFLSCSVSSSINNIPSFSLPNYSHPTQQFNLNSELKTHKKIVFNFWASWCTACIKELDKLNDLKEKYKYEKILFVAINVGEPKSKIRRFLKKHPFHYKILMDKNRKLSKSLNIKSLPYSMVVNSNKKILYQGHLPPKKI